MLFGQFGIWLVSMENNASSKGYLSVRDEFKDRT